VIRDCPKEIAVRLSKLISTSRIGWLLPAQSNEDVTPTRRNIYFPHFTDVEESPPVFKRKKKYCRSAEKLKIGYFTNRLIHEIRTSSSYGGS